MTLASAASCTVLYEIQDLGTLPDGTYSYATAVNDAGAVAGYGGYNVAGDRHAAMWIGGTVEEFGDFRGKSSLGFAINSTGMMAGTAADRRNCNHACLWNGFEMLDLGTLGGDQSEAYGINDSGIVVGWAMDLTSVRRVALWDQIGVHDLGTLGGIGGMAFDINNAGQVVGQSYTNQASIHAFLWSKGTMQDLGTLGGSFSAAYAINDFGVVVGIARTAKGLDHAFLWNRKIMQDLGALGGATSEARAINEAGMVVGNSTTATGARHAFVWDGSIMRDLNDLIPADSRWVLDSATGINASGQIAGSGFHDRKRRAFLLNPVNVTDVRIDILGDERTGKVSLDHSNTLPVVVFSSFIFDARSADPSTVRFAGAKPVRWLAMDANRDRLRDMVFYFPVASLNLTKSETSLTLEGQTHSGRRFMGKGNVSVEFTRGR